MQIRSKVMEKSLDGDEDIMVITVEISRQGMHRVIDEESLRKFSNFCGKEIVQQLLKIEKKFPENFSGYKNTQ